VLPWPIRGVGMTGSEPRVLIGEDEVQAKIGELAARISEDYRDVDDLVLVGILKGAFIFLADLARRLTIPRSIDFMAVSTYDNGTTSNGTVRLILDLRRSIAGRHVLVVEDIVDTGSTISYLLRLLAARRPASLKTCALVHKPARRKVETRIDYLGFEIPDVWVVGCGLDLAERYRALPYIGVVEPET
jgi:hypoxanthine phosphoribosyltransferase